MESVLGLNSRRVNLVRSHGCVVAAVDVVVVVVVTEDRRAVRLDDLLTRMISATSVEREVTMPMTVASMEVAVDMEDAGMLSVVKFPHAKIKSFTWPI